MPAHTLRQRILARLVESGGARCIELVVEDLAALPGDRERILKAINRLAAAGVVTVAGKPMLRRIGGAVVRLVGRPA